MYDCWIVVILRWGCDASLCVLLRPEPEGMAPGAVQWQTSGAGRHAAAQRRLRGRLGHAEEPAAGRRLQTVSCASRGRTSGGHTSGVFVPQAARCACDSSRSRSSSSSALMCGSEWFVVSAPCGFLLSVSSEWWLEDRHTHAEECVLTHPHHNSLNILYVHNTAQMLGAVGFITLF